MSNKYLKEGDVFAVHKGMELYIEIPKRFYYQNTPFSDELCRSNKIIGTKFESIPKVSRKEIIDSILDRLEYSDFDGLKFDKKKLEESIIIPEFDTDTFDTSDYIGEYVVERVVYHDGDGRSPSGHEIIARKLKNKKYDKNGKKISFYQDPGFYCYHPDIEVIRTLEKTFK